MIKIKLLPRGKKHQITYRVVVAEDRSKSDGKFIADLGFYTPQTKTLEINKEAFAQWQKNGAQVTEGVDKLLNPDKYPKKIKRVKETKKEQENPAETTEKTETVEETKAEETASAETEAEPKTE